MIMVAAYPNGPALGKSEGGLMFLFFLIWTLCQISFTVCWSSLYVRYKRTSLHAYAFQLLCMIGMLVINMVIYPTSPLPSALFLIPHVAFYRALYLFHQRAYFFESMLPGDEIGIILLYMFLDILIYAVLAAYLQNVMKSEVRCGLLCLMGLLLKSSLTFFLVCSIDVFLFLVPSRILLPLLFLYYTTNIFKNGCKKGNNMNTNSDRSKLDMENGWLPWVGAWYIPEEDERGGSRRLSKAKPSTKSLALLHQLKSKKMKMSWQNVTQ